MRLALRELVRRPMRFAAATVTLTLIAMLLMFLGALLDGLVRSATGAVRAQHADAFVFSADSRASFLRSRIAPELRTQIEQLGVGDVGGLNIVQLGVRLEGGDPRDVVSAAVIGYEQATASLPSPPEAGSAIADEGFQTEGIELGETVLVGPARTPVLISGWVTDTTYDGQPGLWVEQETWAEIVAANRPQAIQGDGVSQALVVVGADAVGAVDQIKEVAGENALVLSEADTIAEIPGVSAQKSTFASIIGVTLVVALVIVALFFALITVERLPLYGTLKAIGASSPAIAGGVVLQAAAVATVATLIAAGLTVVVGVLLPAGSIPLYVSAGRLVVSSVLMLLAAIVGGLASLRRIVRSDPASALGGAS